MSIDQNEKTIEFIQDEPIVGISPEARRLRRSVKKLSKIESNMLVIGEAGIGKEFYAHHIHLNSSRKNRTFVKINCSSLGKTIDLKHLYGEELEGDQAVTRTVGLLEKAHKGILYLDHLREMSAEFQAEFLRILQDKKLRRIGGKETIDLDIRVVAADEDDMVPLVDKGKFRRDLFHLLSEVSVYIPPLRKKKQDIPELFNYFLKKYTAASGQEEPAVDTEIFESIMEYDWKGNVTELENTVHNLVLMSPEGQLSAEFLPFRIKRHPFDFMDPRNMKGIVSDVEVYLIKKALNKYGGNQVKAAKLLGVPEATLRFKMKKYSIPKD